MEKHSFFSYTESMICVIAAVSENGIIGCNGKIPWSIPEDLKRFRNLTMGNAVIFGRKTFESIGKPLKGRLNLVVSRSAVFEDENLVTVKSFEDALRTARSKGYEKAFACGGTEIYREALPEASIVYLTKVHETVEGDASFPPFNESDYVIIEENTAENKKYTFVTYRKK